VEWNKEILRWVLLIGAAPVWLPFLRILWRDFNSALREEGGLFGQPPTARELEELRRQRLSEPDTLISEPWLQPGDRRRTRMKSPDPRGRKDASGRTPPSSSGRREPPRFR
jgi:hypothetical protein